MWLTSEKPSHENDLVPSGKQKGSKNIEDALLEKKNWGRISPSIWRDIIILILMHIIMMSYYNLMDIIATPFADYIFFL